MSYVPTFSLFAALQWHQHGTYSFTNLTSTYHMSFCIRLNFSIVHLTLLCNRYDDGWKKPSWSAPSWSADGWKKPPSWTGSSKAEKEWDDDGWHKPDDKWESGGKGWHKSEETKWSADVVSGKSGKAESGGVSWGGNDDGWKTSEDKWSPSWDKGNKKHWDLGWDDDDKWWHRP